MGNDVLNRSKMCAVAKLRGDGGRPAEVGYQEQASN